MRLCRFDDNKLGVVLGDEVADVTEALDLLPAVRTQRDAVASADEATIGDARAALSETLNALLLHVATNDCGEEERRELDGALSPDAAALKGDF